MIPEFRLVDPLPSPTVTLVRGDQGILKGLFCEDGQTVGAGHAPCCNLISGWAGVGVEGWVYGVTSIRFT